MNSIIFIVILLPIILLVTFGLLIKYKKAYWLISGYNTMPAEKKKKVDAEGLGRLMANMCFTMAAIFTAAALLMFLEKMTLAGLAFALILPVIIYTLVSAQKYDGNTRNQQGKMKTGAKVIVGSAVAFFVLIAIGVGALLYSSNKPTVYSIDNGILKISGLYGKEVVIYEISDLELKDTMPEVLLRTNGSALNSMLKGNFKLKDIGAAMLFVDVSQPPFIYLKCNSKTIFINAEDSAKTIELFNTINDEWKKAIKK